VLALAGAVAALTVASWDSISRGLRNYWRWTIQFAANAHPRACEMLGIYSEKTILLWLAFIAVGLICLRPAAEIVGWGAFGSVPDRHAFHLAHDLPPA